MTLISSTARPLVLKCSTRVLVGGSAHLDDGVKHLVAPGAQFGLRARREVGERLLQLPQLRASHIQYT